MTIRWSLHIVSLPRFSFCWWRHNRLLMMSQWPDNCDTITWIVISNLVDIDFIHGNIHGQSCKKKRAFTPAMAGQRQRAVVLHEFTDSSGSCCAAASASIYTQFRNDAVACCQWGILQFRDGNGENGCRSKPFAHNTMVVPALPSHICKHIRWFQLYPTCRPATACVGVNGP